MNSNMSSIKNAPTCYRAPRWPDPEFPRKIPKKYPPARNSGTPRKYPKNTEKMPKMRILGYFGVFFSIFSGYFGGKFWECRISGRGVFFRHFSWKFRVGPFRGSVAGRGVLKSSIKLFTILRFSGRANLKGAEKETDSPKTPFWTTISPHNAFSAPLAGSHLYRKGEPFMCKVCVP